MAISHSLLLIRQLPNLHRPATQLQTHEAWQPKPWPHAPYLPCQTSNTMKCRLDRRNCSERSSHEITRQSKNKQENAFPSNLSKLSLGSCAVEDTVPRPTEVNMQASKVDDHRSVPRSFRSERQPPDDTLVKSRTDRAEQDVRKSRTRR